VLTQARMTWFEDQYRGPERTAEEMAATPYANPEAAKSLRGCVPTTGIICGSDVLRDEGVSYFRALRAAGSDVDWRQWDAAPHGLFAFAHDPRAVEAKAWLVGRMARALGVAEAPEGREEEDEEEVWAGGVVGALMRRSRL
jgi:acetyl esterase/lipase